MNLKLMNKLFINEREINKLSTINYYLSFKS